MRRGMPALCILKNQYVEYDPVLLLHSEDVSDYRIHQSTSNTVMRIFSKCIANLNAIWPRDSWSWLFRKKFFRKVTSGLSTLFSSLPGYLTCSSILYFMEGLKIFPALRQKKKLRSETTADLVKAVKKTSRPPRKWCVKCLRRQMVIREKWPRTAIPD